MPDNDRSPASSTPPPPGAFWGGLSLVVLALVGLGVAIAAISGAIGGATIIYIIAGFVLAICGGTLGSMILYAWNRNR
ncbi:hypothetical protein AB0F91_44685 [Amycolatopsis sp. NPDC023774]|uniref:hypothetical protein n=1 Tax=Amycolatopsis sp. NPDC023774 TaxID=3155015 RepID=UPI0033C1AF9A